MVRVFVDESGNMGVDGKFFVLAAVVVKDETTEKKLNRMVLREQRLYSDGTKFPKGQFRKELKFSRLKFSQRQRILNKISITEGVDVFYFVAYKPMVSLLREGKEKNLIYNYFSKLLMEKIFKRYKDDFLIMFDQRSTAVKSMNSLTDYIQISAYVDFPNLKGKNIAVKQGDSKTNSLLQVADIVAGAGAQAYMLKNRHFLEILGEKIMVIYEFPKRGFVGSQKFQIGKLKLIDKLRGYN